jgi:hypothetical protein
MKRHEPRPVSASESLRAEQGEGEPARGRPALIVWLKRIGLAIAWTLVIGLAFLLPGCAEPRPVIETVTIEKPVPVPCRIPPIEPPAFAIDRASPADDMVTLNRALRAELEQRRGYELLLEAGIKACQ